VKQAENPGKRQEGEQALDINAKWIWKKQDSYKSYNRTIAAKKEFNIPGDLLSASIAITADTYYRLYINNEWITDGPVRSYPEHHRYDLIDIRPFLSPGVNEVLIIAQYWGCSATTRLPVHAGLLVTLRYETVSGEKNTVVSDRTWQVAELPQYISNVPETSFSQGPFEMYNASNQDLVHFENAVELYDCNGGPWRDLEPRDCPLLTKNPFSLKKFMGANVVEKAGQIFCFPFTRLLYPGLVFADGCIAVPGAVFTVVVAQQNCVKPIKKFGLDVTIAGEMVRETVNFNAGINLLAAFPVSPWGFHMNDLWIYFPDVTGIQLRNPLKDDSGNPWCFLPFDELKYIGSELTDDSLHNPEKERYYKAIRDKMNEIKSNIKDIESLKNKYGDRIVVLPRDEMLLQDAHQAFVFSQKIKQGRYLIEKPEALIYDNAECTVVKPQSEGDIELLYDLGEENVGFLELDLVAHEGLIADIFLVEYIRDDGAVQHTIQANALFRNGLRYIARSGRNRYISLKRRAGRYVFVILRNQKAPVEIRNIRLIESTYPVSNEGAFECSDYLLNRIWDISVRTLKLCMEDTFTDCPLYEQNFWTGDARNEALYAYGVFGAYDLAKRCIRFAAESLERRPMIGACLPGSKRPVLPAWSFLWCVSVWEYYCQTGDKALLCEIWTAFMQNIKNAEKYLNEEGFFCAPFWNMFEWAPIDYRGRRIVLYNNMFFVAAVDAGINCAKVLEDFNSIEYFRLLRKRLADAVNTCWSDVKCGYPDSIHDDGNFSTSYSIHTNILAVLYDVAREENYESIKNTLLKTPDFMVDVASPFANQFLFEALEKLGYYNKIISMIYDRYIPMLEKGATTVWEVYPSTAYGPQGFPTRSHSHAWSSAPVYFLPRIILGLRQKEPNSPIYILGPRPNGLKYAKGSVVTMYGVIYVEWYIDGNMMQLKYTAPDGVKIQFESNDDIDGLITEIKKG
jgi:alpha-L-rhamnosidase